MMINAWSSVEDLAKWQLCKCWHDYDNTLLGEAYIAYTKAISGFDETKGNTFATYFVNCMRRHINNFMRYHKSVVHVPVGSDYEITMQSLDAPVTPKGLTLAEIIASEQEEDDTDISDIRVPPKYKEAYSELLEAYRSGLPEKEFLRNKYSCNVIAHRRQSTLANLRKILRNNKNNIY